MACCRTGFLSHGLPNGTDAGEIPGQADLRRRVGSTLPGHYDDFDWPRLELPISVAAALIRVHASLEEAVRRIEASIERVDAAQEKLREVGRRRADSTIAELAELYRQLSPKNSLSPQEASGHESLASRFDDGFPEQHEYGPLGIGLDVLGAIAFRQADRLQLGQLRGRWSRAMACDQRKADRAAPASE